MAEYYFDIETEGEDPQQDRIITIQYQQLEGGKPIGNFTILAEWEWGEKEMVKTVVDKGLLDPGWDFIPIGNRLKFDLTFLIEKSQKYGLLKWDASRIKHYFFKKPMIDFYPILVLMNEGKFVGSGIQTFTKKRESGMAVPIYYKRGDYQAILRYVEEEKKEAIDLYAEVRSLLSAFGDRKRA